MVRTAKSAPYLGNVGCYVFFNPVGAERTAKIEMAELRDLEPVR